MDRKQPFCCQLGWDPCRTHPFCSSICLYPIAHGNSEKTSDLRKKVSGYCFNFDLDCASDLFTLAGWLVFGGSIIPFVVLML